MGFDLNAATSLLSRMPGALDALLRDLPKSCTERNEGGESMTPREVVAHLIDAEHTNWIPRAKTILEFGEARGLAAFDRYAYIRESKEKGIAELLDEFADARRRSLDELGAMRLGAAELAKRGRHPTLGSVTMAELLAAWATHDLTHLHQISRVLAHQNRDTVGPFGRFLGVLKCEGHGG